MTMALNQLSPRDSPVTEVVRFSSHSEPKPRAELNATFSASFSGAANSRRHTTTKK